jgi:transcriptional regulator of acetoin/glycerol metabolism
MDSTDQNDAQEPLRVITRHAVDQAIAAHGGNMSAAARSLGLHRSTLYRMLQR